jgi:NADH-quinone oxidoreductase subunit C
MPHDAPTIDHGSQDATRATDEAVAAIAAAFPDVTTSVFRGQHRVIVPVERAFEALERLKRAGFDLLVDVTWVDYLEYRAAKRRFGLVYLLASTATNARLTVRVFVDEPIEGDEPWPVVPSVVPLWRAADWLEREVWDLFGIRFEGHPDMRRLVMPEEFSGHPLRKDYPLQGRGERHNFPVLTRDRS